MGLEFQFRTMKSARDLLYNSVPTSNTAALNPEKWLVNFVMWFLPQ